MSDGAAQPTTFERLAEQFPVEAHKAVRKGGREQTYIPWTDKVERFNAVLGQDWSFRIIREGLTDTEAWVLGELSVTIDGATTVRQQYGCEPIVKGQRETPTTDLFKIAGTDALSKAATLFGCGLYLSIQEERAEVEAAMREAVQAAAKAQPRTGRPRPDPSGDEQARAAAMVTGAGPETPQQRWARLVAEAERANLDKLSAIKAIDPKAVSTRQLEAYADRLATRLAEATAA